MEKMRRLVSVVLLAVFLTAFGTSLSHRHVQHQHGPECEQCVHHQPHAGHLGQYDGGLSDCVLCHFLGLPFIVSLAACILPPAKRLGTLYSFLPKPFVSAHFRLSPSRAPPVFSVA